MASTIKLYASEGNENMGCEGENIGWWLRGWHSGTVTSTTILAATADTNWRSAKPCESSFSPIMSYSHFSISSDVNHNAAQNEGFDSDGLTIPRIIRSRCKFSNSCHLYSVDSSRYFLYIIVPNTSKIPLTFGILWVTAVLKRLLQSKYNDI